MSHPNIIYIVVDDMGYGDVRTLNDRSAWPTPNLDRLANEGMTFTDAHSSSAVCTPSRYSIMTGRYCWRTTLKSGVIGGVGAPLITADRVTVADLLKDAGYRTACFGKWHIGWNWAVKPGMEGVVDRDDWLGDSQDWIDFTRPVEGGPADHGFDEFFGIAGSLDMPPYVYVENRQPVEVPTAWGTPDEFGRAGPRMRSLRAHNVLGTITDRAVDHIEAHDGERPIFVYLSFTSPHTPIAPAPEFLGTSGVSPYGDFCVETDARVGQVLDALDAKGIAEDTLVIFTSDNGCSRDPARCDDLEKRYAHRASHIYRGYKSDIWDGGHRVPFLARWPRVVAPGGTCDAPIGIFDLFATAAEITGRAPGPDAGEDSVSFLPGLTGGDFSTAAGRPLIHHSIDGMFAIRKGDWKLCRCPGSGGWTYDDADARAEGLPEIQLYHMGEDPAESDNTQADQTALVSELTQELHRVVVGHQNDPSVPVEDWPQIVWRSEVPQGFILDD